MTHLKFTTYGEILDQIGGIAATDTTKQIVEGIASRIDFHITNAKKRCKVYHHMTWIVHWLLVLLSVAVTSLASESIEGIPAQVTFFFSLAVTILSSVNASILPNQRYTHATEFSNKFCAFQIGFLLDLEQVRTESKGQDESCKDKKTHDLLSLTNKNLSKLIHDYNSKSTLPLLTNK